MAQTVAIPVRVLDMPEFEAIERWWRQMGKALAAINAASEGNPEIARILAAAHITEAGAECWCDPRVEHVPAGG